MLFAGFQIIRVSSKQETVSNKHKPNQPDRLNRLDKLDRPEKADKLY